jgi:hypothetical protein
MTIEAGTRAAGAAGVVGTTLGIIAAPILDITGSPGTSSTAAEITAALDEDRTRLLVGTLLSTAAISLWLVFGAGVWLRMRKATGAESLLSACFAFGLVGFVTLLFAGFTCFLVLLYRTPGNVADAQLLYDLSFGLLAMSGPPTAIALGAFAEAVYRTGGWPWWTAALAALGALTHVGLLASFVVKEGFFSLEGQIISAFPATLFIWILGTGVAMLRADREPATSR